MGSLVVLKQSGWMDVDKGIKEIIAIFSHHGGLGRTPAYILPARAIEQVDEGRYRHSN